MKEWFEIIGTGIFYGSAGCVALIITLLIFALVFITIPTVIQEYLDDHKKKVSK